MSQQSRVFVFRHGKAFCRSSQDKVISSDANDLTAEGCEEAFKAGQWVCNQLRAVRPDTRRLGISTSTYGRTQHTTRLMADACLLQGILPVVWPLNSLREDLWGRRHDPVDQMRELAHLLQLAANDPDGVSVLVTHASLTVPLNLWLSGTPTGFEYACGIQLVSREGDLFFEADYGVEVKEPPSEGLIRWLTG